MKPKQVMTKLIVLPLILFTNGCALHWDKVKMYPGPELPRDQIAIFFN